MNLKNFKLELLVLTVYFVIVFLFYKNYLEIISVSLPFRELYQPNIWTVLIYIIPFLIGFLLGRKRVKLSNLVAISLVYSLPNLLLLILLKLSFFYTITQSYMVLLNPFLFTVGYFLPQFNLNYNSKKSSTDNYIWATLALILACLIFFLNLIPVLNSDFVVGSDVHYHLAMTNKVSLGDFTQNPYFYEERNIYSPLIYSVIYNLSRITHLSLNDLWRYYTPALSFLFCIFYFLFVKLLTRSNKISFLSLLLISSWSQILFPDVSTNLAGVVFIVISLIFFVLFIQYRKKMALLMFIWCFITLLLIHLLSFFQLFLIIIFYLLISLFYKLNLFNKFLKSSEDSTKERVSDGNLLLAFLVLLIASLFVIFNLIDTIKIGELIRYNEIPLSLLYPIGIVSILIYLCAIPGFFSMLKTKSKESRLILSISLLSLNTLFYFLELWIFHSRYFSETALLGISILAATTLSSYSKSLKKSGKILLAAILILFILVSIYPRYLFIVDYSKQNQAQIEMYKPTLDAIAALTENNSVILANPEDFINRYIPSFTGRYIFGGRGEISKDIQWVIIPGCTSFGKRNICSFRANLSLDLLNNPSQIGLNNLRGNYKIDYLLVKNNYLLTNNLSNLNLDRIFRNDDYTLYRIRDFNSSL